MHTGATLCKKLIQHLQFAAAWFEVQKHFKGTGIVNPLDGVAQIHDKKPGNSADVSRGGCLRRGTL